MDRTADFSGIFGETIDLLSAGVRGALIFVAVVGGMNALAVVLGLTEATDTIASFGGGYTYQPGDGVAEVVYGLGSMVISTVATYYLLSYFLSLKGRLPDREIRIWAYVGLTILSLLGMMVGFLLLVIPGIILLVRWSAASGFLISERAGVIDSLGASWDATKGSGWSIFGAGLVMVLGLSVLGGVAAGISGATGSLIAAGIVGQFSSAVGSAVFVAFGIAVYLLVTNQSGDLAQVFD